MHAMTTVDINALDDHGWTALHRAAGSGDLAAVQQLVARGADPFRRGGDQRTPYLVALAAGHREVVGYLRQEENRLGGDIDRVSSRRGERRLYCKAYRLCQLRAFDAWQESGADPDDTVVFLHQDFSVTRSPLHGESVIFTSSSPAWQAFCAGTLAFAVPGDIDFLSGSGVPAPSSGASSVTFDPRDYDALRDLLLREFGVELRGIDPAFVEPKIRAYMDRQGVRSLGECLDLVARDPSKLQELGDVVYTHNSAFNRWPAAFTFLVDRLRQDSLAREGRELTVWSAACATGQEPYTVAACLLEHVYRDREPAFRVLATDCSPAALRIAEVGRYAIDDVRRLEPMAYQQYFAEADEGHVTVRPHVRAHVTFRQFNFLTSDYAALGRIDVGLLLVEPHTPEASATIVKNMRAVLNDGGYLIAHAALPVPRDEVERCGFEWIQDGCYRAVASVTAA
jgi:chemotaxis methyl-accepting protein methylase